MRRDALLIFMLFAWSFSNAQYPELFVRCADSTGAAPDALGAINHTLFFQQFHNHIYRDLWTTDGDTANITLFQPGVSQSPPNSTWWTGGIQFDNHLYFFQTDSGLGYSLWKTNGSHAGTQKVVNISTTVKGGTDYVKILNKHMYFKGSINSYKPSLIQSDGTDTGTYAPVALNPGGLNNVMDFVIKNDTFL